jgi:hypothetical protein
LRRAHPYLWLSYSPLRRWRWFGPLWFLIFFMAEAGSQLIERLEFSLDLLPQLDGVVLGLLLLEPLATDFTDVRPR